MGVAWLLVTCVLCSWLTLTPSYEEVNIGLVMPKSTFNRRTYTNAISRWLGYTRGVVLLDKYKLHYKLIEVRL
jgi:hypothetical protein